MELHIDKKIDGRISFHSALFDSRKSLFLPRPYLFISTVIVAPMTTRGRRYPTRIACSFQGKKGQIILDQIRTIDTKRFVKKLGVISKKTQSKTLALLQELFAP